MGAYVLKRLRRYTGHAADRHRLRSQPGAGSHREARLKKKVKVRLISMPSFELFEQQSDDYKKSILPPEVPKRLIVEAASEFGWSKYAGSDGGYICID